MKVRVLLLVTLLASMTLSGFASDAYLIALDGNSDTNLGAISGYPGQYWGRLENRLYLYGNISEIDWLNQYHFQFRAIPYDSESSVLYISYLSSATPLPDDILDRGDSFVISVKPIVGASSIRKLSLRPLPVLQDDSIDEPGLILNYNADVDSIISNVNQDTLISNLAKLTGATPVEIDGGLDTIKTRYSGTADNTLAARYLKSVFENYGYQTSYHSFYTGTARDVATYGNDRAWVVTENSEALRTSDGGLTWHVMPDNSPSALWGVDNIGPDSLWISGYNGVIRFSSDGGATFVSQTPAYSGYLFGIDFINSREGWIAADIGIVLHTSDSGRHWSRQTTSTETRLYDINFADSLHGWAVGRNGVIISTTDGGQTWSNQVSNTSERLYGVHFNDINFGWAAGWNGVVLFTFDGGANWEQYDFHDQIEKYHIDFTDVLHGCIVGWEGTIYYTSDSGMNWTRVISGTTKDLYGIDFADERNGIAVGDGIILRTTDGGLTWSDQTAGIESNYLNVVATKPGTIRSGLQVILCAHYDNTSEQPAIRAPGADGNGSGVVGVIEAARLLRNTSFEKTIKFCLWTGEEQGLLGSAAYAADAFERQDTIKAVFNYDMISYDSNNDGAIELHCGTLTGSQALGHIFQDVLSDYHLALAAEFYTWNSSNRSDHASFWDYDIPAMLGIEDYSADFNPFYHTSADILAAVDRDYYRDFTKALIGSAVSVAVIDSVYMSVDDEGSLPTGFALRQNYPNPFNAQTAISFYLPERSIVSIEIFDLLGRKIQTINQGILDVGEHNIIWDAGKYSSGIYLYRLQAGERGAIGRMVLEK